AFPALHLDGERAPVSRQYRSERIGARSRDRFAVSRRDSAGRERAPEAGVLPCLEPAGPGRRAPAGLGRSQAALSAVLAPGEAFQAVRRQNLSLFILRGGLAAA